MYIVYWFRNLQYNQMSNTMDVTCGTCVSFRSNWDYPDCFSWVRVAPSWVFRVVLSVPLFVCLFVYFLFYSNGFISFTLFSTYEFEGLFCFFWSLFLTKKFQNQFSVWVSWPIALPDSISYSSVCCVAYTK